VSTHTIILISIDNLRADCVGANPDPPSGPRRTRRPGTPTLDALAASGTFFQRCFAAASYTTASHASMLTGVFPVRHQVREYYRYPLNPEVPTVFELFKNAGYETLLATDFPFLLGPTLGFTRSVDRYLDQQDAEAINWIAERRDRPAFAFVHFGSVHNPFGLTSVEVDGDEFLSQVQAVERLVGSTGAGVETEWPERERSAHERHLRQRYFACTDALYESGRYDDLTELYVKGVEYFDRRRLARFIERLRAAGILDRALLVVTGDHGEEYSTRAFGHFNGLWEGIVNVPLIVAGPGVPRGVMRRDVCRTVDIVPTLADLAGLTLPAGAPGFDGVTLRPLFEDAGDLRLTARGEVWFGHSNEIRNFMERCVVAGHLLPSPSLSTTLLEYARNAEWKLVLRTDLVKTEETAWLFHVEDDRTETHDLAASYPDVAAAMRAEIVSRRGSVTGTPLEFADVDLESLRENLKDLGYLPG